MFLDEVKEGMRGRYRGLCGGLPALDTVTNGIQKKTYYLIGSNPKAGKTGFVDHRFVISPYLYNKDKKINWIYFSFEVDRLEKMAKYAAYFLDLKYNIYKDSNYILSRGANKLTQEHLQLVEQINKNVLEELFGTDTKSGRIRFYDDKLSPGAVWHELYQYAEQHGKFIKEGYIDAEGRGQERVIKYEENDPELHTIIILDHLGLARRGKGLDRKENIDQLSSHAVWFRNFCKFTFVYVSQFNRDLGKVDRLKFSGSQLQPTLEDFKETSNTAEDADMVLALFNAPYYQHIDTHLGYDIARLGPAYRSVHILASRNTESNISKGLILEGKTGMYRELPLPTDIERLEEIKNYLKHKIYL